MVFKIKERIQSKLNGICYQNYVRETERQSDAYRQWYLLHEDWREKKLPKPDAEIVIFADRDGVVEKQAQALTTAFFQAHPWVMIAYGDEDCLDANGRRCDPWFKPDWSPDTLDSFQYFGHFFAVRKSLLADVPREEWESCLTDCSSPACHKLLLKLTRKVTDARWIGAADDRKAIAPMGMVLIHMKEQKEDVSAQMWRVPDTEAAGTVRTDTVSAVIPSKDNPDVLEVCLKSMCGKTVRKADGAAVELEILVVDNGSSPENRRRLENMARQYGFCYLYEPMPFNFSRMCNLGAARASGRFLLFLNDDMEIIDGMWLLRLLEKARLPHVGAVGAKLLYPHSDLIQHAGITNIQAGPAHKLLKLSDENSYYHGQNRHIYDMIGVTAACLILEMRKFEEAGRLYEEMAVAYNDVDLCFSLHERGYYNVLRNDVTLYHHESLSRGDDNRSDEKWIRLLQEKDTLYRRHPGLKSYDPFYSRNLAGHANDYHANFMYEFERHDHYTKVRRWKGQEPVKWENGCLTVNVEHGRLEKKLELSYRDDVYWIEGWSYVLGMDNCRYRRTLLLHGSRGAIYEVQVLTRYREDVAAVLPGERNVELAGFVCRIPSWALPEDTYTIAMLARDMCSCQKLYRKTEKSFTIGRSHEQ